jgi:arginine deiminase
MKHPAIETLQRKKLINQYLRELKSLEEIEKLIPGIEFVEIKSILKEQLVQAKEESDKQTPMTFKELKKSLE